MTRKQRSRNQIIAAAIIMFEEQGLENVSMGALAKAAGLTRATIYNLFDSKEAIANAIVQQKVATWSDEFLMKIATGDNGLGLLRRVLFANAKICAEYPNIALHVLTKPQLAVLPEIEKRKSFRYLVQAILDLCQQQGLLRADQSSTYLMFLVLGVYTQMMIFSINTKTTVSEAQIEQMLEILIAGIGKKEV